MGARRGGRPRQARRFGFAPADDRQDARDEHQERVLEPAAGPRGGLRRGQLHRHVVGACRGRSAAVHHHRPRPGDGVRSDPAVHRRLEPHPLLGRPAASAPAWRGGASSAEPGRRRRAPIHDCGVGRRKDLYDAARQDPERGHQVRGVRRTAADRVPVRAPDADRLAPQCRDAVRDRRVHRLRQRPFRRPRRRSVWTRSDGPAGARTSRRIECCECDGVLVRESR